MSHVVDGLPAADDASPVSGTAEANAALRQGILSPYGADVGCSVRWASVRRPVSVWVVRVVGKGTGVIWDLSVRSTTVDQPNTDGARWRSRAGEPIREQRRRARQERHAKAKQRLGRIDAAETQFFDAITAITAAENDLEQVIAAAERRIADARARTADAIAEQRRRQARAAAALHAEGCKIDEVAEILQLTAKQVRDLLTAARSDTDPEQTPRPPQPESPAESASDTTAGADDSVAAPTSAAVEDRRLWSSPAGPLLDGIGDDRTSTLST